MVDGLWIMVHDADQKPKALGETELSCLSLREVV